MQRKQKLFNVFFIQGYGKRTKYRSEAWFNPKVFDLIEEELNAKETIHYRLRGWNDWRSMLFHEKIQQ